MFTLKVYRNSGLLVIKEVKSFNIIRHDINRAFSISAYCADMTEANFFVGPESENNPHRFDFAFIVNDNGNTVESLKPRDRAPLLRDSEK